MLAKLAKGPTDDRRGALTALSNVLRGPVEMQEWALTQERAGVVASRVCPAFRVARISLT